MRKTTAFLIFTIVVIIIINLYWVGKYIDLGLTLNTEMWKSHEVASAFRQLSEICLDISHDTTKQALLSILSAKFSEDDIFEKEGSVYTSRLGFEMRGNKIIKVTNTVEFNPDSDG